MSTTSRKLDVVCILHAPREGKLILPIILLNFTSLRLTDNFSYLAQAVAGGHEAEARLIAILPDHFA